MREGTVVRLGKPIDNSRVVRQVDPRTRREIWWLILLVAVIAGARACTPGRRSRSAAPGRPPSTSTARRSASSRRTAS